MSILPVDEKLENQVSVDAQLPLEPYWHHLDKSGALTYTAALHMNEVEFQLPISSDTFVEKVGHCPVLSRYFWVGV